MTAIEATTQGAAGGAASCHLCLSEDDLVRGIQDPTLHWCRDTIGCNARARLRLGMPREVVRRLMARERAGRAE